MSVEQGIMLGAYTIPNLGFTRSAPSFAYKDYDNYVFFPPK